MPSRAPALVRVGQGKNAAFKNMRQFRQQAEGSVARVDQEVAGVEQQAVERQDDQRRQVVDPGQEEREEKMDIEEGRVRDSQAVAAAPAVEAAKSQKKDKKEEQEEEEEMEVEEAALGKDEWHCLCPYLSSGKTAKRDRLLAEALLDALLSDSAVTLRQGCIVMGRQSLGHLALVLYCGVKRPAGRWPIQHPDRLKAFLSRHGLSSRTTLAAKKVKSTTPTKKIKIKKKKKKKKEKNQAAAAASPPSSTAPSSPSAAPLYIKNHVLKYLK